MSQAGYTPIQLYYSTTAAAVPVNTNLASGELAINITDGKLYYKDNGGTVRLLASNATSAPVLSFSAGTTGFTPSTATTGAITLAGTLGTANGGTNLGGATPFTSGGVVYASSTSALATGSALTFNGNKLGVQTSAVDGIAANFQATAVNTYATIQVTGNNRGGILDFSNGSAVMASIYSASNDIIFATGASYTTGLTLNSTSLYTASGINVGIGLSNPTSRLQILGTTSSYGITSVNPSGYGAFNFGSTTIPAQVWSFLANDNGANSDLQIYGGAAAGIKATLDSAGNLGVNNTSPAVLASTTQVAIKANSSADAMFVAQNSNGLTTAKFGFQFTGGVDNPVIGSYTDHPFIFQTNNTERARFTGSAGGSLLVGTTSIRTTGYTTGNSQYAMENIGYGGAQWFTNRTDDIGSFIVVGKSRGTVVNSNTVVANGDELGALVFMGATGSGVASAAFVYGKVDGATISASSMPGRLSFHTTASGSTAPTEHLRIASTGAFGLSGANYGTTGQVLTSQGSGAAPVWANIGAAYSATALVIAGGGGGGYGQAGSGGGGAGGYIETTVQFAKGSTYTVTVGAGGAGAGALGKGVNGGNSSVGGIASLGGGGGSTGDYVGSGSNDTGLSGGSGGGSTGGTAASGTAGQGNNGGYNTSVGAEFNAGGAGGGGAGAVGGNASFFGAGNGGNGLASSITGSSVTRGGGGGGGHYEYFTPTPATGGTGGGGDGSGSADPTAGTANTGGGGGGGGAPFPGVPPFYAGAAGGSGVVILSIPTALYSGTTTGSPTVTTSGANTILTFNSSGSYTA